MKWFSGAYLFLFYFPRLTVLYFISICDSSLIRASLLIARVEREQCVCVSGYPFQISVDRCTRDEPANGLIDFKPFPAGALSLEGG